MDQHDKGSQKINEFESIYNELYTHLNRIKSGCKYVIECEQKSQSFHGSKVDEIPKVKKIYCWIEGTPISELKNKWLIDLASI